jgi:hypothetical protein
LPRGRTNRHGRGRPARPGSPGFILADALAAILIAAIALAAVLGSAAGSVRLAAAQGARLLALVQQENARVQQAPDVVDTIR